MAVLVVIGFHAFPYLVPGGFTGVDVFFVISGFLITSIILGNLTRNTFSFLEFYSRRIRRIFPALLLVLAASFVLGWFVLLPDEYRQLGKHTAGGAGFMSNIVLWDESGYFDDTAEMKPLLHLWSLGIEEQFYIFWPLLLWLGWKLKFSIPLMVIVIGSVSFAINIEKIHNSADTVGAFYLPQTRFWELLSGSILALTPSHMPAWLHNFKQRAGVRLRAVFQNFAASGRSLVRLRNIQSITGAGLIVLSIIEISKDTPFPSWWGLLPAAGAVLIISAGPHAWMNRRVLSSRHLVWLGLISFPLYLWHWPLLSFARIVERGTPPITTRITLLLISVILAWLTYRLIEKPLRFGERGRVKSLALISLMLGVACLGYYCYEADGFGFRFPAMVRDITHNKFDNKQAYREGSCFLGMGQDHTGFSMCVAEERDNPGLTTKGTMLLWGDSYAAHLYPGYKALSGNELKIIQRNAAGCPPIPNVEIRHFPHCRKINDRILQLIEAEKPTRVILAANWPAYDWRSIAKTITRLREMGINEIDLIGPVPHWDIGLPTQLLRSLKQKDKFYDAPIPERMRSGLNVDFITVDHEMAELGARLGVRYISPAKILCDESGCLTRVGNTSETLTSWDYGHLTRTASEFLVSRFPR